MFFSIIVRMLGGFWSTRTLLNRSRSRITRKILALVYYEWLAEHGSWIGDAALFSGIPIFPHGISGIFISAGARIGRNCVIFQQVTIGSNTIPSSKGVGVPTICDNVYIGAGAKIIGNVVVGKNCRIGANCVVTRDIPDNCLVALPEAVVIQRKRLDNRFYLRNMDGWFYEMDNKRSKETNSEVVKILENAYFHLQAKD